jgi:hypothetical protein
MWLVRCDCGTKRAVIAYDLRHGKSKSCGDCIRMTKFHQAAKAAVTKHGMDNTYEYRAWTDMRRRCHQPHRPDYKNYGARGIYVCDEWRASFEAFYRDMGPRPPDCMLDRRDNDGPYSPENCQWVTRKQSERNKRSNHLVPIKGKNITVAEAVEQFGIPPHKLYKLPKIAR